jgi:hypothetical protein
MLKIKSQRVEVFQRMEIIPPLNNRYLHQKLAKITLRKQKVDVVDVVEILFLP